MMFSSLELSTKFFQYSSTNCPNELCPCGGDSTESDEGSDHALGEESEDIFHQADNHSQESQDESLKVLSLWESILRESEEKLAPLHQWQQENRPSELEREVEFDDDPVEYLNEKIFPILLPIMERMLIETSRSNALENEKCLFNGLDYIAQHLWHGNPKHPERSAIPLQLFDIPPFKHCLKEHPRPFYPKSWLWTKEHAARYIQRYVRGWLVRKRTDVQELRQFWKALASEKTEDNIGVVPSVDDISTIVLNPEKLQQFTVCERYRLLTKLCTGSSHKRMYT